MSDLLISAFLAAVGLILCGLVIGVVYGISMLGRYFLGITGEYIGVGLGLFVLITLDVYLKIKRGQ